MIKKILFISSIFVAGLASAQTFQIMDHYDVSIEGMSHYERGSLMSLSETKFHVKNLTGTTAVYTAKVYELANPTSSDLQICYGSNCYTADDNTPGAQTNAGSVSLAGGVIDSTFKAAPFTFSWVAGDSAVWRVIVRNVADPADTVSATITWKADLTTAVKELSPNNIKLTVYPNPVVNNLTVKYDFKIKANNAELNVYDVLGQEIVSRNLSSEKGIEKIDVSSMNSGVYFYAVKIAGKTVRTERFIVR